MATVDAGDAAGGVLAWHAAARRGGAGVAEHAEGLVGAVETGDAGDVEEVAVVEDVEGVEGVVVKTELLGRIKTEL